MSDDHDKQVFCIIPSHIFEIENIKLSYLRVYETIFQFWHRRRSCFLSNKMICERTKIKSVSTVKEAIAFFESIGEMKRSTKNGRRFLIQPELLIENDTIELSTPPAANSAGGAANSAGGGPLTRPPFLINNNNLKREEKLSVDNSISECPNSIQFTETSTRVSIEKNLVIVDVFEKFRAYAQSKKLMRSDWSKAFEKWVLDERKVEKAVKRPVPKFWKASN